MLAELFTDVEAAIVALGASPWLVVVVGVCCCVDAVFPIVPSDSLVTAATVLALANDASAAFIVVMALAAAVGAILGDSLAYLLGSKITLHRIPILRRRAGQTALQVTRRAFARRGSALVLTGRFIPAGRIVVNMSAGATGFPIRRFLPLALLASILWASLATAMGALASHLIDSPLLAMVIGVVVGMGFGLLIDWLMQRRNRPVPDGTA